MRDQHLTCDTCGRVGNQDDGIEAGGPCQEPCDGIVRHIDSAWDDQPDYPVADWKYEVANDDTRLGYLDWVANLRHQDFLSMPDT